MRGEDRKRREKEEKRKKKKKERRKKKKRKTKKKKKKTRENAITNRAQLDLLLSATEPLHRPLHRTRSYICSRDIRTTIGLPHCQGYIRFQYRTTLRGSHLCTCSLISSAVDCSCRPTRRTSTARANGESAVFSLKTSANIKPRTRKDCRLKLQSTRRDATTALRATALCKATLSFQRGRA